MRRMRNAIIPDLSFSDYLAHPGYGSSDLRAFAKGPPAMVPWQRANRSTGTQATQFGSAAHCGIMTPELFTKSFVAKPSGMEFRTKEAKAIRDGWLADGMTIVDAETYNEMCAVRHAFFAKKPAKESLAKSLRREATVLWTCEKSGLPCKGRPDWFDAHAVYDLKVSIEAEKGMDSLRWRAHSNGWLNQLAHNRAGLNANGHGIKVGRLVVIASSPPQEHRVWLLEVTENDMDFLELDNLNTRLGMAECHRTDQWPGTPDDWNVIELPASAAFTENDLEGTSEILTS